MNEARRKCWFLDSKGLVVTGRSDLAEHKRRYAHPAAHVKDLISAVRQLKPSAIIGVAATAKAFDREVIETMAQLNARPIIFPLSNPTSKSECTAEDAYTWSAGRAVFASGSPFAPVTFQGETFVPGQCNNVYIFPGVALGVMVSATRHVTDRMFAAAARALVACASPQNLAVGRVFPPLTSIRDVSARVACAVMEEAFRADLARIPHPADPLAFIQSQMWQPQYVDYTAFDRDS